MTAAGSSPAIRARSQPASVCPARVSTPPGCAMTGKMCPGWLRSSGRAFRCNGSLHRARPIMRRDAGRDALGRLDGNREVGRVMLIGVGHHQRQSKLRATLARQRQTDQAAAVRRHVVDVFGTHFSAAMSRSPSFSRFSSSTMMTILPALMSAMMSSMSLKDCSIGAGMCRVVRHNHVLSGIPIDAVAVVVAASKRSR